MKILTFELEHESSIHYGDGFEQQISVTTIDNQPSKDYSICWHIVSMNKLQNSLTICIKLKKNENQSGTTKTETIITLDLNGLITNNCKVGGIQVYYRKVNNGLNPIAVNIFIEPQRSSFGNTEQLNYSYTYREIVGNGTEIKLSNLTPFSTNKLLLKQDLDNEYRAINTEIKISINQDEGDYTPKITKNTQNIQDSNIQIRVKKTERVDNFTDFVMYTYTFRGDGFNGVELDLVDNDGYYFMGFNSTFYNNINLDVINVYFSATDQKRKIPLLIQFRPKLGHKFRDSKQILESRYYELSSTEETTIETHKTIDGGKSHVEISYRYKKIYEKTELTGKGSRVLTDKLETIYKEQKVEEKFQKMIPTPEKQISSGGSSTPGIVIGVLGLICIPAGVLGYIHFKKIISALRSFRYRFSYLYH